LRRAPDPNPVRAAVCGLNTSLSATVNNPVWFPLLLGANDTLIAQLAVEASVEGQVFVSEKSPVVPIPEIVRAVLPKLVRVTVWVLVVPIWATKDTEAAERRPTGPSTPVPERVIVFTLPVAESVKVSSPVRVPVAVGVKVTATAQSFPSARPEPQVFVEAKSPLVAKFVIVSGPLPRSPTATVSGWLVTPRP